PAPPLARPAPALLGELTEALPHRLEAAVDGTRRRVVERDTSAGARDDLGDTAAHLPRSDDQHVPEHRAEATRANAPPAGSTRTARPRRRSRHPSRSRRRWDRRSRADACFPPRYGNLSSAVCDPRASGTTRPRHRSTPRPGPPTRRS